MVEAAKLSAVTVVGIAGAFIVGVGCAYIFTEVMKAYYAGWVYLFGFSGLSNFAYITSLMLAMFTGMFAAAMRSN
jgi:hypothetical protein